MATISAINKASLFTITYLVMSGFGRAWLTSSQRRAFWRPGDRASGLRGCCWRAGRPEGSGGAQEGPRPAPPGPPCLGGERQRLILRGNRGEAPRPHRLRPLPAPWADSRQCGARTPSAAGGGSRGGGGARRGESNLEVSISLSLASFCSSRKGNLGLII